MADFDSPFETLAILAEVVSSDDEMLSLELGTLCQRYPDVSHEQIFCLLLLRGDMNRSDAKQLAGEFVAEGGNNRTLHARSILSQVAASMSFYTNICQSILTRVAGSAFLAGAGAGFLGLAPAPIPNGYSYSYSTVL